jgi:hypothetical protein
MSKHHTDAESEALPKPVTLTPEQVQQVAAGTAASLQPSVKPPIVVGIRAY